jgi:integrase
MNNKNIDGVIEYLHEGKVYFEVVVQKRDINGKSRKKTKRFTKDGRRISSFATVNRVKAFLLLEFERTYNDKPLFTWSEWKVEAVHRMRQEGLLENTLKNYLGILERWKEPSWDDKFISEISHDEVKDYIYSYLSDLGASDWTRKNIHKRLHRLFDIAVESGYLKWNPARGIKVHAKKSEGVALSPTEVNHLLSEAKKRGHEYYPHWVIALSTGMRNGELYALRYSKINFDCNNILIDEQFTSKDGLHPPKKGKTRVSDLSDSLRVFLLWLKENQGPVKAKLWRHEVQIVTQEEALKGQKTGNLVRTRSKVKVPVTYDDLVLHRIGTWGKGNQAKVLREFCKEIGIREAKFHDLRATHITNLLSHGNALGKVMKQVGHSNSDTTDAYNRLSGVEVQGLTNNLGFEIPKPESAEDESNVINLFNRAAAN